jgi:hypothetical protein
VAGQDGDGQEREGGLAGQGDRRPGDAARVRPAGALHQPAAEGDHQRREQDLAARPVALQQRADDGQQDRYAGDGDRDGGRFGVRDAAHHGDVEQYQSGRRDAGQLEPLPPPWTQDRDAGRPGQHETNDRP